MPTIAEASKKAMQRDTGSRIKLRAPDRPSVIYDPGYKRDAKLVPHELLEQLRRVWLGVDPWPLFLWGEAGSGKTCAALVLADHCGGMYATADGLAEDARLAMMGQLQWSSGYARTTEEIRKQIFNAALMILDEVGEGDSPSDHKRSVVKRVLDLRQGKPLVVISNRDLEHIEKVYGDPIASRIASGTSCHCDGDMRMERGRA